MDQKFAPSKKASKVVRYMRWFDFMVIGRGTLVKIEYTKLYADLESSERLGEEHKQSRTNSALTARNLSLKRSRSPSSDEESSVYGFGGDVPRQVCGACRTKESAVWWKAPRGLPTEVMCDQCGISWRKYGDIRSGRIEETKKGNGAEKRENTPQPPVKRPKVRSLY